MSTQNQKQVTSLTDKFNDNYDASLMSDYVLEVRSGSYTISYDFMARIMVVEGSSMAVVPFSQMDEETLGVFRKKLIALGGKPPELPSAAPAKITKLGAGHKS